MEDDRGPVAGEGLTIVEGKFDAYECPSLVLSAKEEQRIKKPWMDGVIVKLLGRKIGFKALETRLKQLWVQQGIMSIIDQNNDFFLVTFSHEDDLNHALTEGPWLIYDHCLIVRPWRPNFHPTSESIDEVSVWARLSGLPIEYYDKKVMEFIGNRIGKIVRVDKTTLSHQKGKYAWMCVEVDLKKPLLATFELNVRNYKIEYEGLHLLCLNCGKFVHYLDGCPEKVRMILPLGILGTVLVTLWRGLVLQGLKRGLGLWSRRIAGQGRVRIVKGWVVPPKECLKKAPLLARGRDLSLLERRMGIVVRRLWCIPNPLPLLKNREGRRLQRIIPRQKVVVPTWILPRPTQLEVVARLRVLTRLSHFR